ncbi:MAG: polyprenyl synthetase family protein [Desulfomonilaceae bacterium]
MEKGSLLDPVLEKFISENRDLVDEALDKFVPSAELEPQALHEAMRYSLFAGGKRIRPILAMTAAEIIGADKSDIMPLAVALECVHTYSLIHDDLPAMDNDDFRRGKPTCHKVFGESTAILAGDALVTLAFEILGSAELSRIFPCDRVLAVIRDVAESCGSRGLIAGQELDMFFEGKAADDATIEKIMLNKTAALIRAAVTSGARLAGAAGAQIDIFYKFGEKLGMIFQIRDDLLDLEGDPKKLGKAVKKDGKRGKATYPSLHGADHSRRLILNLLVEAKELIEPFGETAHSLVLLTEFVARRVS